MGRGQRQKNCVASLLFVKLTQSLLMTLKQGREKKVQNPPVNVYIFFLISIASFKKNSLWVRTGRERSAKLKHLTCRDLCQNVEGTDKLLKLESSVEKMKVDKTSICGFSKAGARYCASKTLLWFGYLSLQK